MWVRIGPAMVRPSPPAPPVADDASISMISSMSPQMFQYSAQGSKLDTMCYSERLDSMNYTSYNVLKRVIHDQQRHLDHYPSPVALPSTYIYHKR